MYECSAIVTGLKQRNVAHPVFYKTYIKSKSETITKNAEKEVRS